MAVFKWQGGSLGADEGRDQVASDWRDLTTGKSGVSAPGNGDTSNIAGIYNAEISRLGALYLFPVDSAYTLDLLYAPPTNAQLQTDPNSIVGYTLQDQVINLYGNHGPLSLWLQNSHLVSDQINVAGTAIVQSYLDSSISGTIDVGSASTTGFLQIEPIPADTDMIEPGDHTPVTTLDATVTIAGGSTFDVEASNAVTGIINNGTIDVTPGGTLIFDDVDDAGAVGDVDKDEVPNASDNDMLLGNGGTISIQGAVGHTTQAVIIADTIGGPGAITINGHGAAGNATLLTVDGYMKNQNIRLADGTVRFNDAQSAIGAPGLAGFDVLGGSFTFADAHGTLILNQAPLTVLVGSNQEPDKRTPFTTPISGFGQGDVIQVLGQYIGGVGLTYQTVYSASTGVLTVESVENATEKPAIYAELQLVGKYNPNLFVLKGNESNASLTLTYKGEAGAGAAASMRALGGDAARHGGTGEGWTAMLAGILKEGLAGGIVDHGFQAGTGFASAGDPAVLRDDALHGAGHGVDVHMPSGRALAGDMFHLLHAVFK